MGWNSLQVNQEDKVLTSSFNGKDFYFVHSYIFEQAKKIRCIGHYQIW